MTGGRVRVTGSRRQVAKILDRAPSEAAADARPMLPVARAARGLYTLSVVVLIVTSIVAVVALVGGVLWLVRADTTAGHVGAGAVIVGTLLWWLLVTFLAVGGEAVARYIEWRASNADR